MADFIWLDTKRYPQYMSCRKSSYCGEEQNNYCIAEFLKEYSFEKDIRTVTLRAFADTRYKIYANGILIGTGPSCYGGDYGDDGTADYPAHASDYTFEVCGSALTLFAEVQLSPARGWDFSKGRGMLYLDGKVTFSDGSEESIGTDKSFLCRRNTAALSEKVYDYTLPRDEFDACEITKPVTLHDPIIENLVCTRIVPELIEKGGMDEKKRYIYEFPKIYCGYVHFSLDCREKVTLTYKTNEIKGQENDGSGHTITADGHLDFSSMLFHSAGYLDFEIDGDAILSDVYIDFIRYPIHNEGHFRCSDELLNRIYETVKHTLSICRHSIHLDSPTHKEPLGCTGDYAIEAMLTYFIFGDPTLVRSDILHTADILRLHDGKMFHTSYSLIFAEMVRDYYTFTADDALVRSVSDALEILIDTFASYCGDDGIIHDAPDYMFLDWGYVDSYTLHHPPKALGQTGLNCFWYGALTSAAMLFGVIGKHEWAEKCSSLSEKVLENFDRTFFDREKGLYVGGISDTSPEGGAKLAPDMLWRPANTEKVYYLKQANILPVTYGLCTNENQKRVLEYAMGDLTFTDIQTYFMYYLLRAVDRAGMFDEYGLDLIRKYSVCLDETEKGLAEGWGEFKGDHSHAWGGAPAIFLVKKALGFEMTKSGFEEYTVKPNLMGLEHISVSMPSPKGKIEAEL